MKAIIIGGGIGGMALASALQQQSIEAEVYEQAPALCEVGAGLVLWPNACKALDRLGLLPAMRAVSVPFGESEIKTWHGDHLAALTSPELDNKLTGGALIHRSQLLSVLTQGLKTPVIHLSARCVGVRQESDHVTALFRDGREASGDLLIGADGVHSAVRSHLFGDVPLRYAGYTVWRGITDVNIDQQIGTESWGPGMRFGCRTTTRGRVYWYATANIPEHQPDNPQGRKAELQTRFRGWHSPVEAILAASDESHILRNAIYNMAFLKRWSVGRTTLLGDATHPLTPNLGQGACQAIEDAVTLAKLLGSATNIEDALQTYESQRIPRTRAVAACARRLGEIGQWENAWARALRNQIVKHIPDRARKRQMKWLFHFYV